jgi:hypothetical protein
VIVHDDGNGGKKGGANGMAPPSSSFAKASFAAEVSDEIDVSDPDFWVRSAATCFFVVVVLLLLMYVAQRHVTLLRVASERVHESHFNYCAMQCNTTM